MMNNNQMRIEWNDLNRKEVEEAKEIYRKAKKEDRVITDINGNPILSFSPSLKGIIIKETSLKDNEFVMHILDESGDRRLIWNSTDPSQINDAQKEFKKLLDKGGKAYLINHKGDKGRRIYGFDPLKEEIIIDEKGTKEKLNNFVKACREIKCLPKTIPG